MDSMIAPTATMSFAQSNVEAMLLSGKIWSDGCLALSKSMAEMNKAHLDEMMATWKSLGSIKSPTEAIELHSNLARTSMQKTVETTSKLTQASIKLVEQAMAPITTRVTETFATLAK